MLGMAHLCTLYAISCSYCFHLFALLMTVFINCQIQYCGSAPHVDIQTAFEEESNNLEVVNVPLMLDDRNDYRKRPLTQPLLVVFSNLVDAEGVFKCLWHTSYLCLRDRTQLHAQTAYSAGFT